MKLLLRISLIVSLFPLAALPLHAATILNGSFEGGIRGFDQRAPDWGIGGSSKAYKDSWSNSPDLWNANPRPPQYGTGNWDWIGGPAVASPDGGNYAILLSAGREFTPDDPDGSGRWGEHITQTVTDFIPGATYTLSAHTTTAPFAQTPTNAPPNDNVYSSTTSILQLEFYDPAADPAADPGVTVPLSTYSFGNTATSAFTWGLQSVTFTIPADGPDDLVLLLRNHYKGEKSILLVDGVSIAQIPEPSAVGLAGLAGLALLRRRRR